MAIFVTGSFEKSPNLLAPMPFIVGVGRSGTTLLRLMLDAHQELAIPPEIHFLPVVMKLRGEQEALRKAFFATVTGYPTWEDFDISTETFDESLANIERFTVAAGVRSFYRLYAGRFGKLRSGDKTPIYGLHISSLQRLLPEARFVHIIRDGRDVALSMRRLWFAPGKDIETLASHWCKTIRATRQQSRLGHLYLEVRYEDLIADAEKELRRICGFTDIDYDPSMLRYYEGAAVRLEELKTRYNLDGSLMATKQQRRSALGLTTHPPDRLRAYRWKREMSSQEVRRFERVASDMLREVGYETRAN